MDTLHVAIKNRFIFEGASFSRQNHFLARNRLFFDHLFNYLNLQGSSLSARQIREGHGSASGSSSLFRGSNWQKGSHRMPLKTFALLYVASLPFFRGAKGIYHPTKIKVTLHPFYTMLHCLLFKHFGSDFESKHSDLYSRKINFLANRGISFLLDESATRWDITFIFGSCFEKKIKSLYVNENFVKKFHES